MKGEIAIDEQLCKGCGYCAEFCSLGCISPPKDKLNPQGYPLPQFTAPENCTGCGICGWMCPDSAITVYRYVKGK